MTDEQRQHAVAAIQQALPALEWTLQPAKIKRLSRDFHWFSPLLTEQLAGKQADAVVRPRDEEELRQLVCACAQHQLPLTLRGSATGNYGQLVPLEGGLLVDMTGLNQIVALGNGTVRAQAGIRLADIETAARRAGSCAVCHRPIDWRAWAVSTAAGSAVSAPSTMGRWRRPAMCSASK